MSDFPILSLTTFLPAIGALLILVMKGLSRADDAAAIDRNAKWTALWFTLGTLVASVIMFAWFDPSEPGFQLVEDLPWFGTIGYRLGVDGISILFVLLTT